MKKQRKIPLRKCVVTHEQLPKNELIRIVKNKEGEVFVDPTGKLNGRGAYLQLKKEVIEKAKTRKILNKHLEVDVPDNIFEELLNMVNK